MAIFARIHEGRVVEVLDHGSDPAYQFHSALRWVDVSDIQDVAPGWSYDGEEFKAPSADEPASASLSVESLRQQLSLLTARLHAISAAQDTGGKVASRVEGNFE